MDNTDFSEAELNEFSKISDIQKETASEMLSESHSFENIMEILDGASYFAREARNKLLDPRTPKIACKEKCHWCCHQSVAVTAPEAIRIASYLSKECKPKESQEIISKLKKLDSLSRGKTPLERARLNMPCAFLSYGNCSIYKVRPLRCEKQTSLNLQDCKNAMPRGFPHGSFVEEKAQKLVYTAVIEGMNQGFSHSLPQSSNKPLELTAAVLCALENSNALESWLAGENLFEGAVLKST